MQNGVIAGRIRACRTGDGTAEETGVSVQRAGTEPQLARS